MMNAPFLSKLIQINILTISDDCIICSCCEFPRYSIINLQIRGPNLGHRHPDVMNLKIEALVINSLIH